MRAKRSLKTNRLFPTANKPDPMPQNLAFLFTKITPEQMMYLGGSQLYVSLDLDLFTLEGFMRPVPLKAKIISKGSAKH